MSDEKDDASVQEDQAGTDEQATPDAKAPQQPQTSEADAAAQAPAGEPAAEQPADDAAEQPGHGEDAGPADVAAAASVEDAGESQADPAAAGAPAATEQEQPARLVELAAGARYSATGKRKSAVARVILKPGKGGFELNGRTLEQYFPRKTLQAIVRQPLEVSGFGDRVDVRARIQGGGISGQADAVRHAIAKALIDADPALRIDLKRRQLLTRDPRVKERYKAGLKKARKRPQFSKR